MENEKKIIEKQYEEVNKLNEELHQTIKYLLAVQDMAKAILSVLNLEDLLPTIMNILSDFCKTSRTIIMLKNENEDCLEYAYGIGFSEGIPEQIKKYRVSLKDLSNVLVRVASTGDPEHIADIQASFTGRDRNMFHFGNGSSLYLVPLITRLRVIGILITSIDEMNMPEDISKTLRIFAPQVAIAIENARLYRTLQEQLQQLEISRSMLNRADRFAFLSNISERLAQDIREPISMIGKFFRLLPDNFDNEEFRNGFCDIALESANRVNNLISELLNLVRSKKSQFDMVDLHELIEKTIFIISPHYNSKRIEIVRQYDPGMIFLWIDSEKMKQVLLNIILNAVDFTPANGKIEIITSYYVENGNSSVAIRIKDNGIGIREDVLSKIFDPYFSTKGADGSLGSGGLGLFVALQNIQEHHGTIDVESVEGGGTTFTIKIPVDSHSNLIEFQTRGAEC
ncbi:MAG: ATP-binding protein [Deltaproteobacteria bacterium]|nr:ATP-binding protein [Deltaproteobacteria bacterium]